MLRGFYRDFSRARICSLVSLKALLLTFIVDLLLLNFVSSCSSDSSTLEIVSLLPSSYSSSSSIYSSIQSSSLCIEKFIPYDGC